MKSFFSLLKLEKEIKITSRHKERIFENILSITDTSQSLLSWPKTKHYKGSEFLIGNFTKNSFNVCTPFPKSKENPYPSSHTIECIASTDKLSIHFKLKKAYKISIILFLFILILTFSINGNLLISAFVLFFLVMNWWELNFKLKIIIDVFQNQANQD